MINVNDLLRDHVTLTVDCVDRIYLNGYVPALQVGGQLVNFSIKHLGNKIPSPALLGKRGEQYRHTVKSYTEKNRIPMVKFEEVNVKTMWPPPIGRNSSRSKGGIHSRRLTAPHEHKDSMMIIIASFQR